MRVGRVGGGGIGHVLILDTHLRPGIVRVVLGWIRRGRRTARRTIIVDGQNVRRSTWPNVEEPRLVEAVEWWAASEHDDAEVVVFFDGREPVADSTSRVEVRVGGYADDELVSLARERVRAGHVVLVATSDRELRRRLEKVGAEVPWGGGRLLGELGLGRRRGR
jgi:hypothetical protein